MSISSFMGALGGPVSKSPLAIREAHRRQVFHSVRLEVIEDLERRLSVPYMTTQGYLDWRIPDWLKLLRDTATE